MVIDILFLGAAGWGFLLGFREGIVNTVFRVFSIFIAFMSAFKFAPYMTEVLEKAFNTYNPFMFIVGFLVTFFLTMYMLRFIGQLITSGMEFVRFDMTNQLIGGSFLAFIFVILYSILLWFADGAQVLQETQKVQSYTYFKILEPLPTRTFAVLGDLKPTFQKFFQSTNRMMDEVERNRVKKSETKPDIYDIEEQNQQQQ